MISNRCARKSLVTNCNSIISKNYLRFLVDSNETIYQIKFCTNYSGLILTAYGRLVHYLQARALLPPSGQLFINEVRYNIKGALAETGNLVYAEKGCRITEEHRICHVSHGSGLKEKVE